MIGSSTANQVMGTATSPITTSTPLTSKATALKNSKQAGSKQTIFRHRVDQLKGFISAQIRTKRSTISGCRQVSLSVDEDLYPALLEGTPERTAVRDLLHISSRDEQNNYLDIRSARFTLFYKVLVSKTVRKSRQILFFSESC